MLKGVKKLKHKKITLVGDLNAINKDSYTKSELTILKNYNIDKKPVPTDAIDLINKSKLLGKPLNTGQKFESLYQKCVTHVYTNNYKNYMLI